MKERLSILFSNEKQVPIRIPIIVGILSFGAGLSVSYILGRIKTRDMYKTEPHKVPEQQRFDYEGVEKFIKKEQKKLGIEPPIKDLKDLSWHEKDLIVDFKEESKEDRELMQPQPIFAPSDGDWDYEVELANRTPDKPFVIHRDEFYGEEAGYTQSTLTFYAGDEILVDEDDSPIYNYAFIVGPMLFGHGSGDPNVFHVRNDKRKAEYEILYDPGLYSVEVLGLQIEQSQRAKNIKHSGTKSRKFKLDTD